VLQAVRRMPRLVGVRVGILTTSEESRDRHRKALPVAERYIRKPPTLQEYLDQVGEVIAGMLSG